MTGSGVSYFVRDDEGDPTGYIIEVPGQVEIFIKFVTINADYIREGMARWFPEYSKAGITAVHDFGWAGVDQDVAIGFLKDFEKDGTLGMRICGSYYWNDASIDPVPIAKKMPDENRGAWCGSGDICPQADVRRPCSTAQRGVAWLLTERFHPLGTGP